MKLSLLQLDSTDRAVRAALGDPQRMHQLVMSAFPDIGGAARASLGVLHRVEADDRGGCKVYVQSRDLPNWERLPPSLFLPSVAPAVAVRDLADDLEARRPGDVLVFRLLANATRRIDTKTLEDGVRRHGKRVPLRSHEARVAWLQRKALAAGFELVHGWSGEPELRVIEHAPIHGTRTSAEERRRITFEGVTFEGLLRVTDAGSFREAVISGIGPARAYGFGLLSYRTM
ncbi:MAG: type I-E CRISPR-associated protein Cas6/Cse3/CasE [bacterium]